MYCDTMQYFLMTVIHEKNLFFLYKFVAKNHAICKVDHWQFLYVRCTIMLSFPSGKRYNGGNRQTALQKELKPLLDKVKDIKALLALPETRDKIYKEVFGKKKTEYTTQSWDVALTEKSFHINILRWDELEKTIGPWLSFSNANTFSRHSKPYWQQFSHTSPWNAELHSCLLFTINLCALF